VFDVCLTRYVTPSESGSLRQSSPAPSVAAVGYANAVRTTMLQLAPSLRAIVKPVVENDESKIARMRHPDTGAAAMSVRAIYCASGMRMSLPARLRSSCGWMPSSPARPAFFSSRSAIDSSVSPGATV